jgi:hypothetical protein
VGGTIEASALQTEDRVDVPVAIVAPCVAVLALCSLLLVAVNSSLVGDGSYYLLRAIQSGRPFPVPGRMVANWVREGPVPTC